MLKICHNLIPYTNRQYIGHLTGSSIYIMSLVENASKLSVEMVREVETLTGIKRRLKEQLCRLQVEEKALRELQACEFTTTTTTTTKTTRTTTNRGNKGKKVDEEKSRGVKRAKMSTKIVLDEENNKQRKSISSNEDDVNKQTLYLDLRTADKTDSSSSSKEEIETATEDEKRHTESEI